MKVYIAEFPKTFCNYSPFDFSHLFNSEYLEELRVVTSTHLLLRDTYPNLMHQEFL